MKRLVLAVATIICLTATGFAAGKQPMTEKKKASWEASINILKLSNHLNLSFGQTEEVSEINVFFNEKMRKATYAKKNQDKLLRSAIYSNLKLMKEALTSEQYAKYLRLLNTTLYNEGIEVR